MPPFAATYHSKSVGNLYCFPVFSFRKSTFFDDENIREFIFKGYRIIFRVSKHEITVFGLYKWQETLKM